MLIDAGLLDQGYRLTTRYDRVQDFFYGGALVQYLYWPIPKSFP